MLKSVTHMVMLSAPKNQTNLSFFRLPLLILLPIGIIASLLAGVFVPQPFNLMVAEGILLLAVLLSIIHVTRTFAKAALRNGMIRNGHPIHQRFKVLLIALAFVSILTIIAIILVLIVISANPETFVPAIEIGMLAVTIVFLALFTRFTILSFTVDVSILEQEFRASIDQLGKSFLESTDRLAKAFEVNTARTLETMDKHGERQANILAGMTKALDRVSELLVKDVELAEESRRLSEETVRLQEETKAAAKALEEQKEQARKQQEEQERLRILPILQIRVLVSGTLFHHVHVQVLNKGMSGQNLEVTLQADERQPRQQSRGSIAPQQQWPFDFGDVTEYPNIATLNVVCTVSDTRGRRYRYTARFSYRRMIGWFNRTVDATITPSQFLQPEPEQVL